MFPRNSHAAGFLLPLFAMLSLIPWLVAPQTESVAADASPTTAGGIQGIWQGTLSLPRLKLRLVVKVGRDVQGSGDWIAEGSAAWAPAAAR